MNMKKFLTVLILGLAVFAVSCDDTIISEVGSGGGLATGGGGMSTPLFDADQTSDITRCVFLW